MPTDHVVEPGDDADEARPQHRLVARRDQRQRLRQRRPSLLTPPARRERRRERDEQRELPLGWRVAGQQPQGAREPTRRACRSKPRGRVGRRPEQGDCLLIAWTGRLLDVVGTGGERRAGLGQRGRGALVRRPAKADAQGLVDRAAKNRMTERVSPGDLGRQDDARLGELVECGEYALRVERGDAADELELEWLADD